VQRGVSREAAKNAKKKEGRKEGRTTKHTKGTKMLGVMRRRRLARSAIVARYTRAGSPSN
jgi:hypothetical protein